MAELITKTELQEKIIALVELERLMPVETRVCPKCETLYDEGHRTVCFCDYESERYIDQCADRQ